MSQLAGVSLLLPGLKIDFRSRMYRKFFKVILTILTHLMPYPGFRARPLGLKS